MAFYVALVAILNVALGYGLAVFIRRERERLATTAGEFYDEYETDEWED